MSGWGKTALMCLVLAVSGSFLVDAPAFAAKVRIRAWLRNDYIWQVLAERFEKANPKYDVDLIGGDIDKFYTMITAGMMPDVWGPWDTPGITADVNRNWALDLTPFIKRDAKVIGIDDFFPGLMRQFKVKGKQYSLPIFSYTDWFFYNTDMWAAAGVATPPIDAGNKDWNWDAVIQNAQKTTKRSADGNRILKPGLEFARTDFWNTPNWIHLWGVNLYSKDALASSIPQDVDLNSPRMTTALQKMWDLIYKYKVVNPAYTSFSSGNVGASMEHGWKVFEIAAVKKLKWGIAPLPWAVTNSGTLWPDGLRVSRISKNKEAAWAFVKFLCSPESMKTLVTDPKSQRRGSAVARKSVFVDTMSTELAKITGMKPTDIMKVHEQADDVGIVKESETISLHTDLSRLYIEPVLTEIWANKINPAQAPKALDERSRKGMQILYQRWMRNIQYTGKQI